jgi:hypothetical protein
MNDRSGEGLRKIVPFAPQSRDQRDQVDPLDQSGQTIMGLLHQAADIAKSNCDRAMDMAHKLTGQLRAAEARIKELEQEARYYQDRAARAEHWLAHISKEIENKFLAEDRSADRQRQQQQPRN